MKFDEATLQQFYRYSYALTGHSQNAYDLMQGSLEKYLRQRITPEHPMVYVKRIIHNQFVDDYRRMQVIPFESYEEDKELQHYDERTLESVAINADLVEQMFEFLNPSEREVLYFWAVEGMSTAQIAAQLETPRGTILSRIHRLRKRLQIKFGDNYSDGVVEVAP